MVRVHAKHVLDLVCYRYHIIPLSIIDVSLEANKHHSGGAPYYKYIPSTTGPIKAPLEPLRLLSIVGRPSVLRMHVL